MVTCDVVCCVISTQVPVSKYAAHCYKSLERISQTGAKKGLKKPTLQEIEQAKVSKWLLVCAFITCEHWITVPCYYRMLCSIHRCLGPHWKILCRTKQKDVQICSCLGYSLNWLSLSWNRKDPKPRGFSGEAHKRTFYNWDCWESFPWWQKKYSPSKKRQ